MYKRMGKKTPPLTCGNGIGQEMKVLREDTREERHVDDRYYRCPDTQLDIQRACLCP
jgi:hypothetical protein